MQRAKKKREQLFWLVVLESSCKLTLVDSVWVVAAVLLLCDGVKQRCKEKGKENGRVEKCGRTGSFKQYVIKGGIENSRRKRTEWMPF